MREGRLDKVVTIQVRTEVSDGHDGFIETWAPRHRRIPAEVKPLTGRDLERAMQVDPRISHGVTLRYWFAYHDDLDGGRVRVVYHDRADRTFEVVGPPVDLEERHDEILLTCREATDA